MPRPQQHRGTHRKKTAPTSNGLGEKPVTRIEVVVTSAQNVPDEIAVVPETAQKGQEEVSVHTQPDQKKQFAQAVHAYLVHIGYAPEEAWNIIRFVGPAAAHKAGLLAIMELRGSGDSLPMSQEYFLVKKGLFVATFAGVHSTPPEGIPWGTLKGIVENINRIGLPLPGVHHSKYVGLLQAVSYCFEVVKLHQVNGPCPDTME